MKAFSDEYRMMPGEWAGLVAKTSGFSADDRPGNKSNAMSSNKLIWLTVHEDNIELCNKQTLS